MNKEISKIDISFARPIEQRVISEEAWNCFYTLIDQLRLNSAEETVLGYLIALRTGILEPLVCLPAYQTPTGRIRSNGGELALIARIREVSRQAIGNHAITLSLKLAQLRDDLEGNGYNLFDFI